MYDTNILQLMVDGVNGLCGMAVVFPVALVRKQDRGSAQIPGLSMEDIIVLEQTWNINHVLQAYVQVIITTFIIYVSTCCCYFISMVEKNFIHG